MAQIFVCKDKEMQDGDVRIVRQDRLEIGVYRHAGSYYAYRNHCLHQGGPACEGVVKGKVVDLLGPDQSYLGQTYDHDDPHIVCPWHGYEFNLKTGRHPGSATHRLRAAKLEVVDGEVHVLL